MSSRSRFSILLPWVTLLVLVATAAPAWAEHLKVWHAYRGAEEEALQELTETWNKTHPDKDVRLLSVPYDAYANKLTSAIPRGNGPDVFIAAHERCGDWSRSGLLHAWGESDAPWSEFHPTTVAAVTLPTGIYGVPLAYKSLVLFYNPKLISEPPSNTEQMIRLAQVHTNRVDGQYGLAYQAANFYMHAPWLFGFDGRIFDEAGDVVLDDPANIRSLQFAYDLVNVHHVVPEEATGVLVSQLFNEGKAAMVINGPWFLGEIADGVDFKMAPLPRVSETNKPARPFLTVETAFVSAFSEHTDDAKDFAKFLASADASVIRAEKGKQPVATLAAYDKLTVGTSVRLSMFRKQLDASIPMPNNPKMRSVWEPAEQALRQVMRGAVTPELALQAADRRVAIFTRPAPESADPTGTIAFFVLVLLSLASLVVIRNRGKEVWKNVKKNKPAYLYVAPAMLAMLVLVVTPFVVGSAVSLFAHRQGEFTFVGLSNFIDILMSKDFGLTDPSSFYFTLAVTVLWTVTNVFLHVTVGLGLALILRNEWVKLRGIYRVLLIIPWAVPNYITALIWRGMFHKQFGAINGILVAFGVEPVSWFSQFSTSFAANLATNVWLGFPFMMVVTLGALQAIPRDLEQAAEVDGANRWQRFRHVTFPLLRPALVPAVVLGTVWTFNSFNIIYLVSMGEPDGSTEILISEAYKWAFTRQEQYGYAAAYAVLIFFVLLIYSLFTGQLKTDD